MSAAKKVVVILGAGPKVGLATASKFQAAGYTVAVGSRKPALDELRAKGLVPFRVDLSDPVSVPAAFDTVVAETGAFPEVIIYNAVSMTASAPKDSDDPLSHIPAAALENDMRVNTISFYAVASAAIAGWQALSSASSRPALIFTGNPLPWVHMPWLLSLGIGKAASASLVSHLVAAYGPKGFRFYFTYQLAKDGGIYLGIDGEASAHVFLELAQQDEQGPWEVSYSSDGVYGRGRTESKILTV